MFSRGGIVLTLSGTRQQESQWIYHLGEVVRAEDREAVVNADRRDGRRNDGGVAKQKTKTANLNRQRKKRMIRRRSQAKKSGTTPKTNHIIAKLQTTLISYILT